MSDWNNHLKRQIWKHHGDNPLPKECEDLFKSISESYNNYEKEHALLNRIMDLSSQELFDANTELRKRNEELDRFVYSTSHDLRAPLTSILGLLQLIKITNDVEEKENYLDQIKISTEQLDNFIQDIVSYTHNKKMDVEVKEIDLEKLTKHCIDKLGFMSDASTIKKTFKIKSDAPFYSDPQRIENLISNLISNSIKYQKHDIDDSFIDIEFVVDKKKASINVSDNGIGIKEVHIDKIFNMFYRASPNAKGSGIGLYIVKEIINKLKGHISVISELGQGTRFAIEIPNVEK